MLELKGRKLLEEHNIKGLVITRGEEGVSLIQKEGKPTHIKANTSEVYDVTGAGDTFISTLSLAINSSKDFEEAVRISNIAAGIVVKKKGTSTVDVAELYEVLDKTSIKKMI